MASGTGSAAPAPAPATVCGAASPAALQARNHDPAFRVVLLTGNSNRKLAEDIAERMGLALANARVGKFPNGEVSIQVESNVRGCDVFIIQPTCTSEAGDDINASIMELLLLIHTVKLASAKRITAVVPHFAYARQDRKTAARVPISASAVAQLIMAMGVDRLLTVDLHCGQIQGFFHCTPVDNLYALPEFVSYYNREFAPTCDAKRLCIVSPDAGGVARARVLADMLHAGALATILKRRLEAGKVDSMQLVGDVDGCTCWIVDDMTDTSGTLVKACELLKSRGAQRVCAFVTHGLLTAPALDRINACDALEMLVVTDTTPQGKHVAECTKLRVLTIAPMLARAIENIHQECSLSELFRVD